MLRHALTALLFLSFFAAAADRPPNVVLIFTDDQGYGDVGCYGAKGFQTPNIDSLAKNGTRLTNFHVAQAVCSASRAALLTGCYPNRIGIAGALSPSAKHGIGDKEVTLAEMLKARGYATGMAGKWHLGHHPRFLPTRNGFDEYYGLPYSNDMWPNHPSSKFPDLPLIEGENTLALNPDQSRLTTDYTQRAVAFIEANAKKEAPFFFYLAHSMPHVPLFVSEKHKGKTEAGLYGDVLAEIDWSVGEVLAALKRNGLDDNTVVIYTSDNGPWLSYGHHAGSAGPLREGKGTAWEGGTRVPCLIRWPGKIPAGRVLDEPLMSIDIFPTLARLSGGALPEHRIDGLDVWPILASEPGAKNPHDAYYFYYASNELRAVLSGAYKLVLPHSFQSITEPGKDGKPGKGQARKAELALYDLSSDIGETTNVAEKFPDVVERLQTLAERAREDLGDSLTKRVGKNVREPGHIVDDPK